MTTLRTPSPAELTAWWTRAWMHPMQSDRDYYRAQQLYTQMGLDWRDAEHTAHVHSIVERFGEGRHISITGVRETND